MKLKNNVDLRTSTVAGALKQIRKSNIKQLESPELMEVWVVSISPRQTKLLLKFVEIHVERAEQDKLNHLKRFQKRDEGCATIIDAVLCTTSYVDHKEISALLINTFPDNDVIPRVSNVPRELPLMKEVALSWSEKYWPMAWKGNPNHQALLTADLDIMEERYIVEKLCHYAAENPKFPFVTVIAEKHPTTGVIQILHSSCDQRDGHPLHHSVMNAIDMVAQSEKARKLNKPEEETGYLCHNLLVYTTFEPCAMCAMALVHSRIGRLTYLFKHARGAIESSYFIGDRRDLNWTYDIWRWVEPIEKSLPLSHSSHLDP